MWPPSIAFMASALPFIRHVHQIDAGHGFEHLGREVRGVPAPEDAKSSPPGFDFASAMNSFTFVAGNDGCTTSIERQRGKLGDRREILDRVERQFLQRRR